MLRTATNVTGDLAGATIIARSEGDVLLVQSTRRGALAASPEAR
jgi:Na+/H+-dicarboxylate symporter